MTKQSDKDELPWIKLVHQCMTHGLGYHEIWIEGNCGGCEFGYFIPESEARRLHALDERVKMAEEAARWLVENYDLNALNMHDCCESHEWDALENNIDQLRKFLESK